MGQASYTWGSGADLNLTRPMAVRVAWLEDSGGNSHDLRSMTAEQYAQINVKTNSGRPERYYFEPELTPARITFDYQLRAADTFYARVLLPLTRFTSLDTADSVPDGYLSAIKWNLAERLCPEYGMDVPRAVENRAALTFRDLKRKVQSTRVPAMELDLGLYLNRHGHTSFRSINEG